MQETRTAELQKRWGRMLAARRALMGYAQQDLADVTGVSKATISEHERGERGSMHPSNRAALERALRWAPGSVARILNGGDPELLPDESAQSARVIDLVPGAQAVVDELSLVTDPDERRRLIRGLIEFVRSWRDNGW